MNETNRTLIGQLMDQSRVLLTQALIDDATTRDRIVRTAISQVNARAEKLMTVVSGDTDRERQRQRSKRIKRASDGLRNAVGEYQDALLWGTIRRHEDA